MKLYPDVPQSEGAENVIKRARQLTEFPWTPVCAIPGCAVVRPTASTHSFVDSFHAAWRPKKGILYSSVRLHEKFVGYNVSFETYVTALANPNSVLYTRPQHKLGNKMFSYYGTVCSALASYAFNLPFRIPCSQWASVDGMNEVTFETLEELQLCDILLKSSHVAVITGIKRNEEGAVRHITVSEATLPLCVTTEFTAEAFRGYWLEKGYHIYRYSYVDQVPYTPSPYVPLEGDPELPLPETNPSFMTDFGNAANYTLGETVEFSVLEPQWTEIRITGAEEYTVPINDAKAAFTPKQTGFYTAYCVNGDEQSKPLEFGVTHFNIKIDSDINPTMVSFAGIPAEDTVLGYMINTETHSLRGKKFFTEQEAKAGQVLLKRPAAGRYYVIVLAKNKFGVYKSEMRSFVCTKA